MLGRARAQRGDTPSLKTYRFSALKRAGGIVEFCTYAGGSGYPLLPECHASRNSPRVGVNVLTAMAQCHP
jgi:hypothetical protein